MKSLIYRHTTYRDNNEVTTIYILGMPVFKRVINDTEDRPRRSCGFQVFASDAPTEYEDDYYFPDETALKHHGKKEKAAVRH